jgi:hypothetical protein
LVGLLLAAFAAQCVLGMRHASPTSDEVPHLTAGYTYLKTGDYRLNFEHPPVLKLLAGLPLLGLGLDLDLDFPAWADGREWAFGEQFINKNRTPPQTIIFWGRLPMMILGLLLGVAIYRWAAEIYGRNPGLIALFLFAFSPNMIANTPLVTMDVGNTLFTLLTVYGFYRFLVKPSLGRAALMGAALGLALGSKITSFMILPICAVLAAVLLAKRREGTPSLRSIAVGVGLALGVAAIVILVAYRVVSVRFYLDALRYFVQDVGKGGRPAYLFGKYSSRGWFYYFPAAMLVKTPVPSLVLLAVTIVVLAKRRALSFAEYCLVVPPAIWLVVSSVSRLQLGLRYILPVYPFLFVLMGGTIGGLLARRPGLKSPVVIGIVALLGWYAVGTLAVSPHYLAYFNELVGGPKNGYKCLLDSNLDWGQDLPGLADFLRKEGNPEVILSFFGTAAPSTYGITYQEFYSYNLSGRREDHINSLDPEREFFVISANSLQCLYYPDKTIYDWLKKRKPMAIVGHTLFVYDVTQDSDAQTNLGIMYLNNNYFKKGERQFRRALAIDPFNRTASQYLEALAQRPRG